MARAARATAALTAAGAAFEVVAYPYDPRAERVGLQAAEALREDPGCVLKTLMVVADGKPACAILASDAEVSMKRLAAALGAKSAAMMKPADAERISGYKIGGVSPFGQTRLAQVVLDRNATHQDRVYLNAGQRGLQVRLAPAEAIRVLNARVAAIRA